MPLQPKLNKFSTASPLLASYNYFDVDEGTGIKIYYGAGAENSVGIFHILTDQVVYASHKQVETGVDATVEFDLSPFNQPKSIKGEATIEGSFDIRSTGSDGANGYVTFTFAHFDGDSTYTTIGTAVTQTVSYGNTGGKAENFLVTATLTETHFAQGEGLRITAVLTKTGTSAGNFSMGCDPKNRDSDQLVAATNHTSLIFHIPYKLEI